MSKDASHAATTTDELKAKLAAARKIYAVVIAIFGVIILAWIVLGLWRENVPVFISTVAMAVAISALLMASRNKLSSELKKRELDASQAGTGAHE